MELLLDENRGIYIPQVFCKQLDCKAITWYTGMETDIQLCLDGPDNEYYWDAWENILHNLTFIDGSTLHHEGDLWVLGADEEIPESI